MGAMDAGRLELYDLLKPKLDEEPARKLVLALHTQPENLLTKDDLASAFATADQRLDVRFAAVDARFAAVDARFVSLEQKMDVRFAQMDVRFAQLETALTRRMIAVMGAWSAIVSIAWGTALAVLR